jgi:DNA-directed RNA polymerase
MAYGGYGGGGGVGFRRGGFRRFNDGPREMHKIKCSECGKDAEVPFQPKEGLPVYCRECFFKKKGITPRGEMSAAPATKPEEKPKKEDSEEESDSEEEF